MQRIEIRFGLMMVLMVLLTACASTPQSQTWGDELQQKRFAQAQEAYNQGRYVVAGGMLIPLAERGHPQALYTLGYMNFLGQGMKQNSRKAIELFRRAAALGDNKALDALVRLAIQGLRTSPTGQADMPL